HRGRWSQTNGWALTHHSSSTFLSSRRISIDGLTIFSFSVVKSWFLAIHGWLTGAIVEDPAAFFGGFSY
ncbi:hypothetical protein, partial [Bacillus sp. ISL-46]|uniref:hypothetical protein n=1 Tax=Bacillus sp. ISL-46 TaxID=2819129 RepID=UPI001BEC4C2A